MVIKRNSSGIFEYVGFLGNDSIVFSGIKANDIERRDVKEISYIAVIRSKAIKSAMSDKQKAVIESEILQTPQMQTLRAEATARTFTGTKKILCILMSYQDVPFTRTQAEFNNLMNQSGYNSTGSVRDFYMENSYGQLALNVTVVGPYTADHTMAYYGANNSNERDIRKDDLIKEGLEKANPHVNYADFDNDGDGEVDGVHIIYAGFAENVSGSDPNTIWPHRGWISGPLWGLFPYKLDGVKISGYSCSSELRGTTGTNICGIGTTCHELGHVFGAPDFYDRNDSTGGLFRGTGQWDLMGGGGHNGGGDYPAHFNPYTKINTFGWATAKNLPADNSLVMLYPANANSNSFYKIPTPTSGEYFLIENRQRLGFDASLPGHGMIVWHVHKDIESDHYAINTTHPQRLYPMCASATQNPTSNPASYGDMNSPYCPFPGWSNNISFAFNTMPTAKSWIGHGVGKDLRFITESGNNVTFVVNPLISGPSAVCSGATATFIVDHSSSNYSWDKSSNLILNSSSSNSATFTTSFIGGSAWISFSIDGIEVARKDITVGSLITGVDNIVSVATNRYSESPLCSSGWSNTWVLTWSNMDLSVDKPDIVYGKTFVDVVSTASPNNFATYFLRLIQANGNEFVKYITVQNVKLALSGIKKPEPFDPLNFSLSPNPATSSVTISLQENEDTEDVQSHSALNRNTLTASYTIQLWNSYSLVKSVQTDLEEYQMDLHGIPAGFYYVLVIKDGQTYRKQLMVK